MQSSDWNPGKIMELSGSYWKTCTLHAAVKLDIFSAIGNQSITGDNIADKIDADTDATKRLLNALTAMGLLLKQGESFCNTKTGRKFLSRDSRAYLGFMILHHHHLVQSWSRLDEAICSGKPVRERSSFSDNDRREAFLMGMFNNAMLLAPRLVKEFDLTNRKNFLDLGGGPGTYAIHFCLNNPELKATVYDLPTTRPFAEKTITGFGLGDRISFAEGNFVKEELTGIYDVIWMSHMLHGEGPETCYDIVRKAASVLEPGGMIMIHEFILDNTMDAPLFPALFSMNMLLGTDEGRSYSEEEIFDMLKAAGLKEIQRSAFRGPTDSGVITAKG